MRSSVRGASGSAALRGLLACLLLTCGQAGAAQYTFTTGPLSTTWFGSDWWKGRHALPGVYCVQFPRPASARRTREGFLNGGAISFFRVDYEDRLAAYVVTSTVPAGRGVTEEYDRLATQERRNAAQVGSGFRFSTRQAALGPVIALELDNVLEEAGDGPFPLVRPMFDPGDGSLVSTSAHRLFVRGPDRFEIAVLGAADTRDAAGAAAAREKMAAFADALLASLQACTAAMPVRVSAQAGGS